MRRVSIVFMVVGSLMPWLGHAQEPEAQGGGRALLAQSPQYPVLPHALEIELTLSAAPKHFRDDATVWTLAETGYTSARKDSNAFTCVVSRRAGDLFPVCWDAEATRSLLPLNVDDARLRLSGKSGAESDAIVTAGFTSGDYHALARPTP